MNEISHKNPSFFVDNPYRIIRYLLIFFSALLLLASCSSSKNYSTGRDYTKNSSRTSVAKSTKNPSSSNARNDKSASVNYSSGQKVAKASNGSSTSTKNRASAGISESSTRKSKSSAAPNTARGLRSSIIDYAKQYIGVKYVYGGRTSNGFDCSGFTCHVMDKFNLPLPPTSTTQLRSGRKISWTKAQTGDLIFFGNGGRVNHVGIVTENTGQKLYVIHSTKSKGVKIDEIKHNSYWRPKIIGASNYIDNLGIRAPNIGDR